MAAWAAVGLAALALVAAPADARRVPMGAAVWGACIDPAFAEASRFPAPAPRWAASRAPTTATGARISPPSTG